MDLKKFIYISSALTLGYGRVNISEKNPGKSARFLPYVRNKKRTEDFFFEQYQKKGFPVTILRPGDVFGPNDRTTSEKLLRGIEKKIPVIVGHGRWIFGFCYIDNLCKAAFQTFQKKNTDGKAYTVTNSVLPTWRALFSGFQKELGKKQRIYVPVWFAYLVASIHQGLSLIFPNYTPPLTLYRIKRVTSHTSYDISGTLRELEFLMDNSTRQQIKKIVTWYLNDKNR